MMRSRVLGVLWRLVVPVMFLGIIGVVLTNGVGLPSRAVVAERALPRPVPVAAAELVCPGPETIGVRGADEVGTAPTSVGVSAVSPPSALRGQAAAGGATGELMMSAVGAAGEQKIAAGSALASGAFAASGTTGQAQSVVVRAAGVAAPGLIAEQTSVLTKGDLRGVTSVACVAPTKDVWLVGGGGEEGRRGRLVMTNPHVAGVEVSVDVLSAVGPVARTAGSVVAVKPNSRVVLLLDALAPGVKSPVLRVRSTGGSVAAVLHDARLDGLVPRGVDDVAAGAPPSRRMIVPGVVLPGSGLGSGLLRVGVPGVVAAVAQVRVFGQQGPVELPNGGVVRVAAGSTTDVDLGGLAAGAYAVQVDADVPVVAGAMVERWGGKGGPADVAWAASAAMLVPGAVTGVSGVAAKVAAGQVLLTAPGSAATLRVVSVAGDGAAATSTVDVPAGSTRVVDVPAGRVIWLVPEPGAGPVAAARVLTKADPGGALLSVTSLQPVTLTEVPVIVAPVG